MFNIDEFIDKNSKVIFEEINEVENFKSILNEFCKMIMHIAYAAQSYDKNYKIMAASKRKPAYYNAVNAVRDSMKKVDGNPMFKVDKNKWQEFKSFLNKAEREFPATAGSAEEKKISNLLSGIVSEIRTANSLSSASEKPARKVRSGSEEASGIAESKRRLVEFCRLISHIACAVQSFSKDMKETIPPAQRKPAYTNAVAAVKNAIGKVEGDQWFKINKNKWQEFKDFLNNANAMFPAKVDSPEAQKLSKLLMGTIMEIKGANVLGKDNFFSEVLSSAGHLDGKGGTETIAKELTDDQNQQNYLKHLYATKPKGQKLHADLDREEERFERELAAKARYAEEKRKNILAGIDDRRELGTNQILGGREKMAKYNRGVGEMGERKIANARVVSLKDNPIDGCTSVKRLVELWANNKVAPAGQIEIVSREGNGLGVVGKPIVYINGKYYAVPRNDLFTNAKGGIATASSPYRAYTKSATSDPKHDAFRSLLNQSSVITKF